VIGSLPKLGVYEMSVRSDFRIGNPATSLVLAAACCMVVSTQTAAQDSLVLDTSGEVGIGIEDPERQLHLRGQNAVFRMDRSVNSAAFMLVRTNNNNDPLKTYVVGVRASAENQGDFVINDLGSSVSGGGSRRMTISNSGDVSFTGDVDAPTFSAAAFVNTSSARYKDDIETLVGASESLARLRGVRFNWKDSGERSLGLVAEEVSEVFPEVVQTNPDSGQAEAINYAALTAVLVEALKEQQARLDAIATELASIRSAATNQDDHVTKLCTQVKELEHTPVRLSVVTPQ
jgi:hypothetical protein